MITEHRKNEKRYIVKLKTRAYDGLEINRIMALNPEEAIKITIKRLKLEVKEY